MATQALMCGVFGNFDLQANLALSCILRAAVVQVPSCTCMLKLGVSPVGTLQQLTAQLSYA